MNDGKKNERDFQKKLAKLQIQASAVITVGAILIALGVTIIATLPSSSLYPWNGFTFLVIGILLMLYHLFSIRNNINELE